MNIFKPNDNNKPSNKRMPAKQLRNKRHSPRGAIIRQPERSQEEISLSTRKKLHDSVVSIERKMGLNNRVYVFFLLLIIMLSVLVWSLQNIKTEAPINSVVVKGDFFQINKKDLEDILSPLVGSNYFDTNIANIKHSLMGFSWVQSVQVRKVWPATLEVTIVENKAIAAWGDEGFVNEFGEIFKPKNVDKQYVQGLPDLNGLDKESDLVLSTYVDLSNISSAYHLTIKKFSLVANSYWHVQFSNKVELMLVKGREKKSIETFLHAYEQSLKHNKRALVLVDMRYNNGFSVLFDETKKATKEIVENESKSEVKKMNMSYQSSQPYYFSLPLESIINLSIVKRMIPEFLTSTEKVGMHHA